MTSQSNIGSPLVRAAKRMDAYTLARPQATPEETAARLGVDMAELAPMIDTAWRQSKQERLRTAPKQEWVPKLTAMDLFMIALELGMLLGNELGLEEIRKS